MLKLKLNLFLNQCNFLCNLSHKSKQIQGSSISGNITLILAVHGIYALHSSSSYIYREREAFIGSVFIFILFSPNLL